jgi:hypothetical protein
VRGRQWSSPGAPISALTAPLPQHIAALAGIDGPRTIDPLTFRAPTAEELPKLADLAGEGWALLAWDQRMIWSAWPVTHRGWMPDRIPRFAVHHHRDGSARLDALTRLQERYLRADEADWWRGLDLPPPPRHRLWLVRSPWPTHTVAELWNLISRRAAQLSPSNAFQGLLPAVSELVKSEGSVLADWQRLPLTPTVS